MNPREYLIINLKYGEEDITEKVKFIRYENGYWYIRFFNSTTTYQYIYPEILYSKDPLIMDIANKGLYVRNKHINTKENDVQLIEFDLGHRVVYKLFVNNRYEYIKREDFYISQTNINQNNESVWGYLCELAEKTGLKVGDKEYNILSEQYKMVDIERDNVPLAQYLGSGKILAKYNLPNVVYYPFGCNKSQKKAVENALTNQVSIIQGPPGTGKTQTILNIIANLIVQGKNILVVSNNNSAVENVLEKLNKEGLGFIVAQLGKEENKQKFIDNQNSNIANTTGWITDDIDRIRRDAKVSFDSVSECFDAIEQISILKSEYNSLTVEESNDKRGQSYTKIDWLLTKPSKKLIRLLSSYQSKLGFGQKMSFFNRLRYSLSIDMRIFGFLKNKPIDVIGNIKDSYYQSRKNEIERTIENLNRLLSDNDISKNIEMLREKSMTLLKHIIATKYPSWQRVDFKDFSHININPEAFLKQYPIVLSTTHSSKKCISKEMVFDYVIMDEASQVDIATGALALSCALNAVIVGDQKQLPNVVAPKYREIIGEVNEKFNIDKKYNALNKSFLQSCLEVFDTVPIALLREHYRCHPKIIDFCNQKFYNGELITMTSDNNEENVLEVITTPTGCHAKTVYNHEKGKTEKFNDREIAVIKEEIIPNIDNFDDVGIITPYSLQAKEINRILGKDIADTIHKYQGRECDTIIMSMVDNSPTEFSDDDNLLNVAISRAKKRLYIVTNGNEMPKSSNIYQLINYIRYNNCEVRKSNIHSVFDMLYKEYTKERLSFASKNKIVSDHLSENIIYNLIVKVSGDMGLKNINVLLHYPISLLIWNWDLLDEEEKTFAKNRLSHVDFLIYHDISKHPIMAIEVDGWYFHNSQRQKKRDVLKDSILNKIGLPLSRISTNGIFTECDMRKLLSYSVALSEYMETIQ